MLSLRLETIRGSFLTEYSGILKGFWTRYQWNYNENPYFVSKMHFPQKVNFDMGLVGNFGNAFFHKKTSFLKRSHSHLSNKTKIKKKYSISKKLPPSKKKREKKDFFPFMCSLGVLPFRMICLSDLHPRELGLQNSRLRRTSRYC